jgi:hypothetical protein
MDRNTLVSELFSGDNNDRIILGSNASNENRYPDLILYETCGGKFVKFNIDRSIGRREVTSIIIYKNEKYNLPICLKIELHSDIDKIIKIINTNKQLCKNIVPVNYLGGVVGRQFTIMPVMETLKAYISRTKSLPNFNILISDIFNNIMDQIKNLQKIEIPEEYEKYFTHKIFYSDLKIDNVLMQDNEPYLCDIESMLKHGYCVFSPVTQPECISLINLSGYSDSIGLLNIDTYCHDINCIISFQLGGFLLSLLNFELYLTIGFGNIQSEFEFISKHWRNFITGNKILQKVKNIHFMRIQQSIAFISRFAGEQAANLMNIKAENRTNIFDLKEIKINKSITSYRSIDEILRDGNSEELISIIKHNPDSILLINPEKCNSYLMIALEYYKDDPNTYEKNDRNFN